MEFEFHDFTELFAQLGLANDPESIQRFIKANSPLSPEIRLEDAGFWSASQSALLKEELMDDADWAVVVDRLNIVLRRKLVN